MVMGGGEARAVKKGGMFLECCRQAGNVVTLRYNMTVTRKSLSPHLFDIGDHGSTAVAPSIAPERACIYLDMIELFPLFPSSHPPSSIDE